MKLHLGIAALALGIVTSQAAMAQTSAQAPPQVPAGAPAGTTGQCNDGTFTSTASKKGACKGHQGVKAWYAPTTSSTTAPAQPAAKPAPTPATTPAATPTPGPATAGTATPSHAARSTSSNSSGTPAPGGGPNLVWVNTSSNVYHCPGTKYYGLTKTGKYMTEADAKAAGAHPDHGKGCGL